MVGGTINRRGSGFVLNSQSLFPRAHTFPLSLPLPLSQIRLKEISIGSTRQCKTKRDTVKMGLVTI